MEIKRFETIVICTFVFLFLSFFSVSYFKHNLTMTGFTIFSNQPDETTGKDTYIREISPDNNYGNQETLKVGKISSGTNYRSMLWFNVSNITNTDTVISAQLQVYVATATNTQNMTISVYRITSDWEESEATWNNRTASATWTSSGGDINQLINSTTFTNSSGVYYNFTITSLVRNWVNGSFDNFGLMLLSSDAGTGNYTDIASSGSTTASQRPLLFIDHSENAVPTITNISTNTNSTSPAKIGDAVNFTVNWEDIEGDQTQLFVCNTSSINKSGCFNKTFCNTSVASTNPIVCSYTVLTSDNRTTNFWLAVCDSNCSTISAEQHFYINHLPSISITTPNGGETFNQSNGNSSVIFTVSDADDDKLGANLYYGETQNSTTYLIAQNINLSNYCTDPDGKTSTPNTCTYSWNTSGIYGTYYLTAIVNDSFHITNDSSTDSFNIRSVIDSTPPNVTNVQIDSYIYSGKTTIVNATIQEPNFHSAWISLNYTSTNYTMTNVSSNLYSGNFTAQNAGTYKYRVYARDSVGNLNDSMDWQEFTVVRPNATTQNETAPSTALPYHIIKISGEIKATDPIINASAYLNVPEGFTFLQDYPQQKSIGNLSAGQTGNATWYLSTPITENTYSLNITYSDQYSNQWNSSNMAITTTSAIGGYQLSLNGYPEVETGNNYYAEAYFEQSGTYTDPGSITVSLYDPLGQLTFGPLAMTQKSTGIYNYTRNITSGQTEGQWETIVNATKSGTSYYAHDFWKVVGGPFDVRDITITDTSVPTIGISFIAENTGGANKDLILLWNLTRNDNGAALDSGSETKMVPAYSELTWSISPSTTYVGQVRITLLGYYSGTEKAGAYKIFSTTSESATTPAETGGGGGGGGGAATTVKEASLEIENFEDKIYLTKNIEKSILLRIKNTGETDLTGVSFDLPDLDSSYYTITPNRIEKVKPGEVVNFEIKFKITDFSGEKDITYKVFSNEASKTKSATLIVLSMKEYFQKELIILEDKIKKLRGDLSSEGRSDLMGQLETCQQIADGINQKIDREEFIDARSDIDKTEKCILAVEDEFGKNKEESVWSKRIKDNLVWVITWGLMVILIIVLIIVLYIIIRKMKIARFIKESVEKNKEMKKEAKDVNGKVIDDKLKNLKDKYHEWILEPDE